MKTYFLFFVVLITGFFISGQSDAQEQEKAGDVYLEVDEMPVFPGGEMALRTYIASNVEYPEKAKKEGIVGKVFVSFVINEKGEVTGVKVVKGVDPLLDKESIRVVSGMPAWQPGKKDGKVVKVQYTIPIQFALK